MTRKNLIDNDAAQHDDIIGRLRRLEQRSPEPPHYVGDAGEPAFQNSWVNFDAAAPPTGRSAFFYRFWGRVYLGGLIRSGASATTAFTLPVDYRPSNDKVVPVVANLAIARVSISAAGLVVIADQPGSNVNGWCYLDGASFRHA